MRANPPSVGEFDFTPYLEIAPNSERMLHKHFVLHTSNNRPNKAEILLRNRNYIDLIGASSALTFPSDNPSSTFDMNQEREIKKEVFP